LAHNVVIILASKSIYSFVSNLTWVSWTDRWTPGSR